MSTLQMLFMEVVRACFAQRISSAGGDVSLSQGELETTVELCLDEMRLRKQTGETFDLEEYSKSVLAATARDSETEVAWAAFSMYCDFQSLVFVLPEFPQLIERFRSYGLGEWTELKVDPQILRPFAKEIIAGVELAVKRGENLLDDPEEAAELVAQISELFEIPLSKTLLRWLARWNLIDYQGSDETSVGSGALLH